MFPKFLDRIYLIFSWALLLEAMLSLFHGLWVMVFHSHSALIYSFNQIIATLLIFFSLIILVCSCLYRSRRSNIVFFLSMIYLTAPLFSSPFIFEIVKHVSMFEFVTEIANFAFLMNHGNSFSVFFFTLNVSIAGLSTFVLLLMRNDSDRFFTQTFYSYSLKRFALSCGVFSVVFLSSLVAYVGGAFFTIQQTIGLSISDGNLVCLEKVFTKGDNKIVLLPMAHMADASFYRNIIRDYHDKEAIFLVEGVKDEKGLLKGKLFYENLAKSIGIASQKNELIFPQKSKIKFVWADVDLSEFNKQTIDFLNLMSVSKDSDKNLSMANFTEINRMIKQEGMLKIIFGDILNLRNQQLLSKLHENLPRSKTIVIAWGAAHMHDLELQIIKIGFHKTEEIERTLAGLTTFFNRNPASAVH